MGWNAGRCRHMQIAELVSVEACDQAVMDFLVATDIGTFPTQMKTRWRRRRGRIRCGEAVMGGYSCSFCSFNSLSLCSV